MPKLLLLFAVLVLGSLATLWYFSEEAPPGVPVTPATPTPPAAGTPSGEATAGGSEAANAAAAAPATGTDTGEPPQAGEARRLVPDQGRGAITGRVVDERGVPVAGASVVATAAINWSAAGPEPGRDNIEVVVKSLRDSAGPATKAAAGTDGRFTLTGLEAGGRVLSLAVKARGYLVEQTTSKPPGTGQLDVGDLVLERAAVIAGRVVDAQGRPVAGALLRRTTETASAFDALQVAGVEELAELHAEGPQHPGLGRREPVARSDAQGAFEMPHATPGPVVLRVTHAEHPPTLFKGAEVGAGEVLDDVVIGFPAAAAISGRVTGIPADSGNLTALARRVETAASVEMEAKGAMALFGLDPGKLAGEMGLPVGERTVRVAADGTFTLPGLHAGHEYEVWAVAIPVGKNQFQGRPCTETKTVRPGTDKLTLPFAGGLTIRFRVIDGTSGAAVTKLAVKTRSGGGGLAALLESAIDDQAAHGFTDYEDGRVTLADLRPGKDQRLTIEITSPGYASLQHRTDSLPANHRGTVDLGTLRLQPAPLVRVIVTDAATGEPVARATVVLSLPRAELVEEMRLRSAFDVGALSDLARPSPSGTTDATGSCSLEGLPGKTATIRVMSDDHAEYVSEPVAMPAAGERIHKVALQHGGDVQVTVLDAQGQPAASIIVQHSGADDDDDDFRQRGSDEQGIATFEHLRPGQHRFRLQKQGGGPLGRGMRVRFRGEGDRDRDRGAGGDDDAAAGWREVEVREAEVHKLTLIRAATGSLRGIVRENGQPLGGARVKLVEGAADTSGAGSAGESAAVDALAERLEGLMGGRGQTPGRAGADGRYSLDNLPAGEHRLRVTHASRAMPALVPVRISAGNQDFDIDLTIAVLSGRVLDPEGQPVAGARISITTPGTRPELSQAMDMAGEMFGMAPGADDGNRTDAAGNFEVRGLRSGEPIRLKARAAGYAPAVSPEIELGKTEVRRGLELKLRAAGSVGIRTEGRAAPLSAVQATYLGPEEGVDPVLSMMHGGSCTLKGLLPGKWKISVSDVRLGRGGENKPKAEKTIEVEAGKTARVVIEP